MEKETVQLDFEKMGGLVPAVVQDDVTQKVLMVGFMNEAAFHKTLDTNRVTFFSRTKGRLWTKGEQSGNFLEVKSILPDCDNDTLLIKVTPCGPVCHTGTDTCFGEKNEDALSFIGYLQDFIERRKQEMPPRLIYHLAFSVGDKPYGTESGRGGCGDIHRSYEWDR